MTVRGRTSSCSCSADQGRRLVTPTIFRNTSKPCTEPPWLSYRYMTAAMQTRFKSLAVERGFWSDESTATHQDLAGIFVARAVERYLKTGGTLAFVVPNPVLDREYWAGFRRGTFDGANVAFDVSWDLRRVRPHLFPRGSGVIFGRRSLKAREMPRGALIWTGRAPHRHSSVESTVLLSQQVGELVILSAEDETSPYAKRFSQGATLVPRLAWRVEEVSAGGLGVPSGMKRVQSKRSSTEKKPWKDLPAITGAVESEFVWPTLLGEQVVPFHVRQPELFVVPLTQTGRLLNGGDAKIDAYPGLAAWTRAVEHMWESYKRSKMTLSERIDHMRGLTTQVPVTQTRVVYAKAGMHLAAAVVTDHRPIIDHKLYWGAVGSESEAHYLVGILNAPVTTELAQPLMSYGKDERDIDKSVWKLPIPAFDPDNEIHTEIAALARQFAEEVAAQTFTTDNFVTIRRGVRAYIATSDPGQKLDRLVADLLGSPRDDADVSSVDGSASVSVGDQVRLIRLTESPAPTADVEIDFDCEYDANGTVYLWGALLSVGGESSYHRFGDPSPDVDERALAEQFLAWCQQQLQAAKASGTTIRFYHYGQVDARQLDRILGAAGAPVLAETTDVLAEVIRPNFYAPRGYSLKTLAPAAGALWRTADADGAAAMLWIDTARTGGDTWDTLVEYNEDDVQALYLLRHVIAAAGEAGSALTIAATPS